MGLVVIAVLVYVRGQKYGVWLGIMVTRFLLLLVSLCECGDESACVEVDSRARL